MQIIGVVKDYHQQALSKNYTPIMLIHKDKIDWLPQRYISIVMTSGNPRELVSQVQEIWNRYFADSSFDYFFLDQFFDHQYRQVKYSGDDRFFHRISDIHILSGTLGIGDVFLFHPYERDGYT